MGKKGLYFQQQQAKQLRAIERNTAQAAGRAPTKLSWLERNVLGVKDPKHAAPVPVAPPPNLQAQAQNHIAYLESRVAALEAQVQWLVGVLEQRREQPPPPPPPPPSS